MTTQSLYEAAVDVLRFFDGYQPPEREKVLDRLRAAVEHAASAPPALENPYHATTALRANRRPR